MFISQKFSQKKPLISFEIFPPRKESGFEAVRNAVVELGAMKADFISVTCGAGGGGNMANTGQVASLVRSLGGTEPLAHLTCVGAKREAILRTLEGLRADGIENVLALRGDYPKDSAERSEGDYVIACDLIAEIKAYGGFCIGAAAYPEGHVACEDLALDTDYLKRKQEAGADFLITQLFFDNNHFYRFLERAGAAGITLPATAGVMPILSRAQIERMIFMAGASLPSPIIKLLHRYEDKPDDLAKAGVEHAVRQMEELLAHGADGVHIYTMNRPAIARTAMARLRP